MHETLRYCRDFAGPLDFCRDIRETLGMATAGLDLRLERVAARVKLIDLAAQMGRDRRTVARYEGLGVVPEDIAAEYRKALATFVDVVTTTRGNAA